MFDEENNPQGCAVSHQEHLGWYIKGLPMAAEFRGRINTIRTKEALLREMEVFFQYIEDVQGKN